MTKSEFEFVYPRSQLQIECAYPAEVVRPQIDGNPVVYVAPVGVMVHRFGMQSNRCHKAEGMDEIRETEFLVDFSVHKGPPG